MSGDRQDINGQVTDQPVAHVVLLIVSLLL